jgi:hypothetical protein
MVAGHDQARTRPLDGAVVWVWIPNTSKRYGTSEGLRRPRPMSVRVAPSPLVPGQRRKDRVEGACCQLRLYGVLGSSDAATTYVS